MKTKNHIDLIGFVGREPAVGRRADGAVLNVRFSLATTDRWADAAGEKRQRTEWHRVVFWDRLAQHLAKSLHPGSFVEVEGSMQSSTYEKDGITRTSWQVRGSTFRLLDRAARDAEAPFAPDASEPAHDAANAGDDIPL